MSASNVQPIINTIGAISSASKINPITQLTMDLFNDIPEISPRLGTLSPIQKDELSDFFNALICACDSMKDGAPPSIALQVFFGFNIISIDVLQSTFAQSDPLTPIKQFLITQLNNGETLKTFVRNMLDFKLRMHIVRRIVYSRIKGSIQTPECMTLLSGEPPYNGYRGANDCGIKALFRIFTTPGNLLDSGPSNTDPANFPNYLHTLLEIVLKKIGYPNTEITINATNYITSSSIFGASTGNLKLFAIGNNNKKKHFATQPVRDAGKLPEIAKFVITKSAGDNLISFYLLLASLLNILVILFTCDYIVFLRQLMWKLPCVLTMKDETTPKMTNVFLFEAKPIEYNGLCAQEKQKISQEYADTIALLSRSEFKFKFKDIDTEFQKTEQIQFISALIVMLTQAKEKVDRLPTMDSENFKTIKQHKFFNFLVPKGQEIIFIRSRKFLYDRFKYPSATLYDYFQTFQPKRGGKIKRIINGGMLTQEVDMVEADEADEADEEDDMDEVDEVDEVVDMDKLNEELFKASYLIWRDIISSTVEPIRTEMNNLFTGDVNNYEYDTVYDLLTYRLYQNPDYSITNIRRILNDILSDMTMYKNNKSISNYKLFRKKVGKNTLKYIIKDERKNKYKHTIGKVMRNLQKTKRRGMRPYQFINSSRRRMIQSDN